MADHDPSIEPLEPVDPLAPDPEDDVGRLEPIDPEAEDLARGEPAAAKKPSGSANSTRRRLDIAVALGILLSLSSMAAIAGLVAISMDTPAPSSGSTAVAPIESAAQLPTIQVGGAAQGPERTPRDRGEPAGQASGASPSTPVSYSAPAPQVVSQGSDTGGGGSGKGDGGGGGHGGGGTRSHLGTGGAWCDAAPGTACDATVGGQVPQP